MNAQLCPVTRYFALSEQEPRDEHGFLDPSQTSGIYKFEGLFQFDAVIIFGPPWIGKTTVAKQIFHWLSAQQQPNGHTWSTSLTNQLGTRYLLETAVSHGIYLVGWTGKWPRSGKEGSDKNKLIESLERECSNFCRPGSAGNGLTIKVVVLGLEEAQIILLSPTHIVVDVSQLKTEEPMKNTSTSDPLEMLKERTKHQQVGEEHSAKLSAGNLSDDEPKEKRADPKNLKTLPSEIQAIFDSAKEKTKRTEEQIRKNDELEQRRRRAYDAWLAVASFRGDGIPRDIPDGQAGVHYARRIIALGQILKAEGWQERVDSLHCDSNEKRVAIEILRQAMQGHGVTVEAMVSQCIETLFDLGLEADAWLRKGLMYEVLGIKPAPNPPVGWEGPYVEPVDTVQDFINWIDQELLVQETVARNRGSEKADGCRIRNAFLLVSKLNLKGMPPTPLGPLTQNNEVTILRDLKRYCLERNMGSGSQKHAAPLRIDQADSASAKLPESTSLAPGFADSEARAERIRAAEKLWNENPRMVFEKLRDSLTEAVQAVWRIYEEARLAAAGEQLENVGRCNTDPLRLAICDAETIWHHTPVAHFLDRVESVHLDTREKAWEERVSGSCHHHLALNLAQSLSGTTTMQEASVFVRRLRLACGTSESFVGNRITGLLANIRCECQLGIARWEATLRSGSVCPTHIPDRVQRDITSTMNLSELTTWFALRVRWTRIFFFDPQAALPDEYVDDMLTVLTPPPMSPSPEWRIFWARQNQRHYIQFLILSVHARLDELVVVGYPFWNNDPKGDNRWFHTANDHLSRLLVFLRQENAQTSQAADFLDGQDQIHEYAEQIGMDKPKIVKGNEIEKSKKPVQLPTAFDDLTEIQQTIMLILKKSNATKEGNRQNSDEIATEFNKQLGTKYASELIRKRARELVQLELLQSGKGRGSGYWLTKLGIDLVFRQNG